MSKEYIETLKKRMQTSKAKITALRLYAETKAEEIRKTRKRE